MVLVEPSELKARFGFGFGFGLFWFDLGLILNYCYCCCDYFGYRLTSLGIIMIISLETVKIIIKWIIINMKPKIYLL